MSINYKHLLSGDAVYVRGLLEVFGNAFEDLDTYVNYPASDKYVEDLLGNNTNIVIVATDKSDSVIGGLIAYELKKFEQERGEIYLYDLAVLEECRRQGVATGLILELKKIGKDRGVNEIFVQADNVDAPALALYNKLATSKETDITHFTFKI